MLELGSSSGEQEEAAALKEEVAHLKERVAYLERDVEGLEAIVKNLADKEQRMAKQVWRLWYDARHNRPFHPSHDEDEFVSILLYAVVYLYIVVIHIAVVRSFVGPSDLD